MPLRWGMIGGREDSQIGGTHRIAARLDGAFDLVAGALDIDPARGRAFALRLGVPRDRAYGDWHEMLESEKERKDRIDLVTVATPNALHYQITGAFLKEGFDVLCEKPLTTTVEDAKASFARHMMVAGTWLASSPGKALRCFARTSPPPSPVASLRTTRSSRFACRPPSVSCSRRPRLR